MVREFADGVKTLVRKWNSQKFVFIKYQQNLPILLKLFDIDLLLPISLKTTVQAFEDVYICSVS